MTRFRKRSLLTATVVLLATSMLVVAWAPQAQQRIQKFITLARFTQALDAGSSEHQLEALGPPDKTWLGPPSCEPPGHCKAPPGVSKTLLFRTGNNELGLDVDVYVFVLVDGGIALSGGQSAQK